MDPKSGRIYQVKDEGEAIERGLIPIPPRLVPVLKRANLEQRKRWAETQIGLRLAFNAAVGETPDARRRARNASKRERRARAEKSP